MKELFGDGALTAEEFEAKVTEKGYKLADLSTGEYVNKNKFDRLQSDFDKYKADSDKKGAEYEEIVKERDALKAEKQERVLIEKVASAKVGSAFQKFVASEVKQKVTDKVTFDEALADYVKENPQYCEAAEKPQTENTIFRIPSQIAGDGGKAGETTPNAYMNNQIRAASKKT